MNNVLSLQLARKRTRQPIVGSNGHPCKRLGRSSWNPETTRLDERRLRERLEAENVRLRRSVVDLLLETQALRDGVRTPRVYDAASHRRDVP